ncbi:hypothetical protein PG984_005056 [Apiospora sp. TS-2023a]
MNRALLIGSNYDDLPGTENDVKTMHGLLERFGFEPPDIKTLSGEEATRKRILDAWHELIRDSSFGDGVVIYYSGHGGMTEQPETDDTDSDNTNSEPRYIQYLVPSDFDKSMKTWKGILDSEISKLLRDTTDKTPNVTYILDCCHSSRLGRGPQNLDKPIAKCLTNEEYRRLMGHIKNCRRRNELLEDDNWSNPSVVRIAAAADTEKAWQHKRGSNRYVGLFTEKLDAILRQSRIQSSWRNILVGVNALIARQCSHEEDPQQPRSGGADGRIPFSLQVDSSQAVMAEIRKGHVKINGGRLRGFAEGDKFSLDPNTRFKVPRPETHTDR